MSSQVDCLEIEVVGSSLLEVVFFYDWKSSLILKSSDMFSARQKSFGPDLAAFCLFQVKVGTIVDYES